MRRLPAAAAIALCLGSSRAATADVADYVGRTVGSVRLLIDGRETTDPMLTRVVDTIAGQPLSMAQVRETVTHLFTLARFEDVRADATIEDGRVALRYELVPIRPVSRIRFTGRVDAPGVDEGALRRAITDRYGVSPPVGRVADMRQLIVDALRERGYLHASVTPRADAEGARTTLVFTIDPGGRTRIGTVGIVGKPILSVQEFLDQLDVKHGAPYQRDGLDARIDKYVAERRSRGYYESKVTSDVQFTDEDRVANLTLTVDPGPHVRVVFTGDPVPADRRAEFLPVEREGSVDEDLLEDAQNRIEEYLRAQGYRDAAAPHRRETVEGELVITFDVERGSQYVVTGPVMVSGNASIPLADFEAGLQLRGGAPFSAVRLQADVAFIERLYHSRGYASATVRSALRAGEKQSGAPVPISVALTVVEGVRTVVDDVSFTGNSAIGEATLRGRVGLQPGGPFVPGQLPADRDALQLAYLDLGYENASVDVSPTFSADGTHVSVVFVVREGPQIFIDHVLIVGNVRTSTATIEHELQVRSGDRFSLAAITESRRRLTSLGLFRRVDIQELRHGEENTRDLLVTVEEAPPTSIGYGGGLEFRSRVVQAANSTAAVDQLELAPRASFDIGRRNLFGKNRSANLSSSVSLHPADSAGQTAGTGIAGFGLSEYRIVGTVREPRVFDTTADAFLNVTFEQHIRSSFNFARRVFSADVTRRISRTVGVTGSYQLQRTRLFGVKVSLEDQLLIDRLFTQFLLSSFSGSVVLDTRDDPVDPRHGESASVNGQLAGERIGSEVGFAKAVVTGNLFRPVPHATRIVFAANARIGLATGFANEGQLPASERFFAGGDTTVRGFAIDQLGVRHLPSQAGDTIDQDGFSIGGNGLVIVNAEVRAPVFGGVSVVPFVDVGNVFARVADLDLAEMRTAVGIGVRYKSPFGPLRFDVGFKVNRQPGEDRAAWFVSFGQAF